MVHSSIFNIPFSRFTVAMLRKILILFVLFLSLNSTPAASQPYFDNNSRFILNGKPFFPLGLFVVQCPGSDYSKELAEIAESPFDTVMNYAVNGCGSEATDNQILEYLNQLHAVGLHLIYSLKDYVGHGRKDLDTITHKVYAFKNHPAVIAWYMNDELGPERLSELEARYARVKLLDEKHSVWSVHWNTDWLLAEAHTTDILGVDPYPIAHLPITHVSEMADGARRSHKPLWLVPQVFDWKDYPGDFRAKTGRPPTRAEMRAMTYLAINHGAKGLIYYSYFNMRDDSDYATRWKALKGIAAEVKQLRQVVLSAEKDKKKYIKCSQEFIDYALFEDEAFSYLFAVNTKERLSGGVIFEIEKTHKTKKALVLFEGDRAVFFENGRLMDDFAPYDVHVYRWRTK